MDGLSLQPCVNNMNKTQRVNVGVFPQLFLVPLFRMYITQSGE